MPPPDDRTPGLANALFGPRLGRPVFVAARTSTPLPMSVTDPATNSPGLAVVCAERAAIRAAAGLWPPPGRKGPMAAAPHASEALLDLGFLEGHVLAGDRIVLFERKLVGRRARVLLGDVEEAGSRRAQQFDLLGDGFGHGDVSA